MLQNLKIDLFVSIKDAFKDLEKNDLLILDEADYLLFDCGSDLPEGTYKILAMSATSVYT